ncbi:MAG: hypothetical protein M1482_13020 [Chloroflexi bacterium]|nr:hypothetical protein [Chloroflexota bacterium]
MSAGLLTGVMALAGLVFSAAVFGARWSQMQRLPYARDLSQPKDSAGRGVLYAFTLGMAPWAKESTRLHMIAYLRGIAFHVGIFAGLSALLISPWFSRLPAVVLILAAIVTGLGAVMGAIGGVMRLTEHNLKAISTADDHAAVWLVTVYLAATAAALVSTALLPVMWVTAAAMLAYAPLGKIKHCIYFFYGRLFYGTHIGRRGVVAGMLAHALPLRGEVSHGK